MISIISFVVSFGISILGYAIASETEHPVVYSIFSAILGISAGVGAAYLYTIA